jgi:hypothetical protein
LRQEIHPIKHEDELAKYLPEKCEINIADLSGD